MFPLRNSLGAPVMPVRRRTSLQLSSSYFEHLHCINTVIWQNWSLIQAARLERDDVYQQLAIRLIRAVAPLTLLSKTSSRPVPGSICLRRSRIRYSYPLLPL